MGLCFCNRVLREKLTSENEEPSVLALPAVPPPVEVSNPRSELPEKVTLSAQRISRGHGSLLAPTSHPPVLPFPNGLRTEGYPEATADNNGEKTQLATSPTNKSTVALMAVSELSIDKTGAGQPGSSSSFLDNLEDGKGILHRTPSPEPTGCRAVEAERNKEDYAVAARRAEVRRLAHRMIQEELRQEHHSQLPRSYKSKTMTTIKEDPSDSGAAAETVPDNKVALKSDGPPGDQSGVALTSRSGSPVLVGHKATAHSTVRFFSLHPGSVSVVHRGLLGFRRFRGANTTQPRGWKWTSLVAATTQQKSPEHGDASAANMLTLPASAPRDKENVPLLDTKGEEPAMDNHNSNPSTLADFDTKSEKVNARGKRHLSAPLKNDTHMNQSAVSDSLSSVDEDGSIHEAREAYVVLNQKGGEHSHSDIDESAVNIAALKNKTAKASPRLSSFIHATSGGGTTETRRPSGVSGTSHISSLDLPPPLVEESAFGGDGIVSHSERDLETDHPQILHAPFHMLSRKVTNRDVLKAKATACSPMLSAKRKKPDVAAMRALKSRRRALLSEIGITLKKMSRAPLDDRFRPPENHAQESQTIEPQAAGGELVSDQTGTANKTPDKTDMPSEQDQTSSALALEKKAEEWLKQIRQLHIESLENQQKHARSPGRSKRYQSHTWPRSNSPTPSFSKELYVPWAPLQRPQGQSASAFTLSVRPRSEVLNAAQLPDSWWSLSVKNLAQDVHDTSARNATTEEESKVAPTDETDHNKHQLQNCEFKSATGSVVEGPTKFEKVMKFGMLKFLSRRQNAGALPAACDGTSARQSAENDTKSTASEAAGTAPEAQQETSGQQVTEARPSINPSNSVAKDPKDDANFIRVLADRASNRDRAVTLAKSEEVGVTAGTDMEVATVQLTAPSTPVKEVYAEVRAYISKSSAENYASRVARRASSFGTDDSFADAVAHQSGGVEHGKQEEGRAMQLDDSPVGTTKTPWWMLRMTAPVSKA